MINVSLIYPYIFITDKMGRLKKYQTLEEKNAVKKQRAKEFYWKNKKKCDGKSKERYRRNIQNSKS